MKNLLFIVGAVALVAAFGGCAGAKTALHEIEGLIALLISAILFAGAAVVAAIDRLREAVDPKKEPEFKSPDSSTLKAP